MGYIDDYVTYASKLTSAPRVFHEAIAHYQIATMLHRGVYIPMDHGDVYPNPWILLVGLSSRTKKSTAIKLGYELVHAVDQTLRLPYDFSPEGLVMTLSARTPCIASLVRDEIGGLIVSMSKKAYMADVKDLLMNLYDCPDLLTRTLMKGTFPIKDVFFTVLGATTPDRLCAVSTKTDVMDGFLARFLVCYSQDYTFRPVRMKTQDDLFIKARLIADLQKVKTAFADKTVEFYLDKEALQAYNDWLRKMEGIDTNNPAMSRLGTYVLKLALTHNISDTIIPQLSKLSNSTFSHSSLNSPSFIYPADIEYASHFVDQRLSTTFDLYRELGNSGNLERVKDIVYTHGPIGHSGALRKSKLQAREFKNCIETLTEAHQIEIVRDDRGNTTYQKAPNPDCGGG